MPTLDRDGVRISYDVHVGPRDATPLLLSHGYGASRAMWRPNIDALVATRTVVTWDMRGHGDSESPADDSAYSHALTVTDMVTILDACGIEQAAVGDTGPGFKNDAARQRWNDYANGVASRLERDGASALSTSAEVARDSADSAGLARAARGMLAQQNADVIRSLPDVKVPTLVLVGADDTNFLAAADYMASTIAHAVKFVVPAAGHAANIDQPQVFNDAVISFLDGLL